MQPTGDSRIFEGKMSQFSGLNDPQLENVLSAEGVERLHEEAELAQIGYAEFDAAAYRHGDLTPVYFGSALKQFGISELIASLAKHAPPPPPHPPAPSPVDPARHHVSSFLFQFPSLFYPPLPHPLPFFPLFSFSF